MFYLELLFLIFPELFDDIFGKSVKTNAEVKRR